MRRLLSVLLLVAQFQFVGLAESLKLRIDGEYLRINAPDLHFLVGHALEKLHNGASVNYRVQLTVRAERAGKILARIQERFTVSYDLWEEKFAVSRQSVPARSASNLSATATESWCIENLSIPVAQLPADRPFWVSLEYATESTKDTSRLGADGLSLGSLVDIFSRRPHDDGEISGIEEVGPIRLEELRKKK